MFQGTEYTQYLLAPFEYEGLYRNIFIDFKFHGKHAAGHLIGMMLEEYFKDMVICGDFDFIVSVPLSKRRLMERGYNQADIMAEYVSRALKIPINNVLERIKHTEAQSQLRGRSRYENVKGVFKTDCDLTGMNILLFDDVFTTGSTVNECAKMLKMAGAENVVAICGAYVYKEEDEEIFLLD